MNSVHCTESRRHMGPGPCPGYTMVSHWISRHTPNTAWVPGISHCCQPRFVTFSYPNDEVIFYNGIQTYRGGC